VSEIQKLTRISLGMTAPRFIFFALGLIQASSCLSSQPASTYTPDVEVFFSPKGGATDACVAVINGAKTTIHVQAYSFTSAPLAKALVDAHKRGVVVQVILDGSQRTAKYSSADFLAHAGIPTFIDAQHAIAHDKIMIFDGLTVITGSFNFTKAAEERNAENLLVVKDTKLASRYLENWQKHREHAETYEPK
jgi:phosphatidylserine/phosphatidylglycerophosphate/cardiolipin synthase-like enzyme